MVIWNLEDIYNKDNKNEIMSQLNEKVQTFLSKKDLLNEDIAPSTVKNMFELQESIISLSSKLSVKSFLKNCEDITNKDSIKEMQKLEMTLTDLSNKLIFFSHFIKDLSEKKAKEILPEMKKYEYSFRSIRRNKPYTRTENEEVIINLKDVSGESALNNLRNLITGKFEFEFQGEKISESELTKYLMDEDEDKRIKANNILLKMYEKNKDLIGEIYKSISTDWYNEVVKIRGYKTSISARNFSNTLHDSTVDMLLNLIQEKKHIFHKYFELKFKILGIKNSRYNVYAPFILNDKKEYSFNDSKEFVLSVFKEFSPEFCNMANKIFERGHVHSEIKQNKRSGAFCYSYDKDRTPFILLNHNNDLNSLLTMAHEFGHGIHGQMAKDKTQMTFNSPLAIAETASIFAEMLTTEKLMKKASLDEKKAILIHHLDGLFASILRQAYFVIFEKQAHQKIIEGTTVDELNELYMKNLKEQFGDKMEIPENFKNEWLRIPHIFESPFYCYAYAFGNLLVLALYNLYKKEGDSFIPKYKSILEEGGDSDIEDILERAQIDVEEKSFWENAFSLIEKDIKELEDLI